MMQSDTGQLLRVFISESDEWDGRALYGVIVEKIRQLGMAGATVLKCAMGFGASTRQRRADVVDAYVSLPVVIEVVDSAAKIAELLPFLDELIVEGVVTIESVKVLKYRHALDNRRANEV